MKLTGWDEATIRQQRRAWLNDLLACERAHNRVQPDILDWLSEQNKDD